MTLSLTFGRVGSDVVFRAAADGTAIEGDLSVSEALAVRASLDHAIAAAQEWRVEDGLQGLLG